MSSHPVAAFAAGAGDRLKDLHGVPIWSMSDTELRESLVHLTQGEAQFSALKLAVLAEADRRDGRRRRPVGGGVGGVRDAADPLGGSCRPASGEVVGAAADPDGCPP